MTGNKLINSIQEFGSMYTNNTFCVIRIKDGNSYKDFEINKIFADGEFKDSKFSIKSIILYSKGEVD